MKRAIRRFSTHPAVTRFGKRLGHFWKRNLNRFLDLVWPAPENLPLAAMTDVQRVIMVRPNFRIGNTLITSPLVLALQRRFPGARIDYLSGETTASLLAHLPLGEVHSISRRFIYQPWKFVLLFARLRRCRYDVAVEAGMGSFSGGIYTYLAGARYRIGCTGKGDRFLNVRLPRVSERHVFDSPVAFARLLGVDCPDHPVYVISAEEDARGTVLLRRFGLADDRGPRPFAAMFVGGHQDKVWPAPNWMALARLLADAGGRVAVFLGPEEMHVAEQMRAGLEGRAVVLLPQPLRLFAAMWARATLIITPDSGPMHLAAALEVPSVSVLLADGSLNYRPRGEQDVYVLRPTVEQVAEAVTSHPRWREIRGRRSED